ncbi:MAG: transglutaminase family protein [Hyphomicrobiales bacterium]|nr:MAG: transglutaminase family protein [Hyphomicrobiales bacterium]
MSILKVHHRTTYRYSEPVGFGDHRWLFRPRDSQEQRLILAERQISPEPAEITWIHDVFSNQIALVTFDERAHELTFESDITLEHTPQTGPRFSTDDEARSWPFEYDADTLTDIEPYRRIHYPDPDVEAWAKRLVPYGGVADTAKLLLTLTQAVRETCSYSRRTDPGTQPPALTLERRRGTCRDFTLLMMEAARVLGFAARFVTGYIYVPARDEGRIRGGGATHAWVQIFLPGAGWVEFDPTNGIIGNRDLIRVGVARDPRHAKPLSGSFRGDRAYYLGMEVDVLVSKLTEQSGATHQGASVAFYG